MSQNNYNGYDYGDDAESARQKQRFGGDEFAAGFAAVDERIGFITKTYIYVIGAIFALIGLEAVLFNTVNVGAVINLMMGSGFSWIVVLLLFMGVSTVANMWANSSTSSLTQHLGLGLYIVAQSIILLPLLGIAQHYDKTGGLITSAGIATGVLFSLMTAAVFLTRADFSFLRSVLVFGVFAFIGIIVFSIAFGFTLGPVLMYIGIALACGYILYDTSNVLHHYRTDQHVAAALALFASVVLLFWYILQLFMSSND
jgi:FtsH-binding integral membrane protein